MRALFDPQTLKRTATFSKLDALICVRTHCCEDGIDLGQRYNPISSL